MSLNRNDQFFDALTEDDLKSFDMLQKTFKENTNEIILSLSDMGKEPGRS
jgi:hypothetical protein